MAIVDIIHKLSYEISTSSLDALIAKLGIHASKVEGLQSTLNRLSADMVNASEKERAEIQKTINKYNDLLLAETKAANRAVADNQRGIENMTKQIGIINQLTSKVEELKRKWRMAETVKEMEALRAEIVRNEQALKKLTSLKPDPAPVVGMVNTLKAKLSELQDAFGKATSKGALNKIKIEIQDVQTALAKLTAPIPSGGLIDGLNAKLSRLRENVGKVKTEAGLSRLQAEIAKVEAELNRLTKPRTMPPIVPPHAIGSINQLNAKIAELIKLRNASNDTSKIKAYNAEIDKTKQKIDALSGSERRRGGIGVGNSTMSTIGQGLLSGVGMAGGMVLFNAAAAAAAKMKEFVTGSVEAASKMEQMAVSFGTMTGSAAKAKELISDISGKSTESLFSIDQLSDYSKRLLAFGIDSKDVVNDISMIGDVAAGVGLDKMPNLILAFGQIATKGKLVGQELRQLTEAGFNPLQIISEKTGESFKSLQDKMSKGQISFEMVRKAFADATSEGGRFNNMMKDQLTTMAGMWTKIGNVMTLIKIKMGEAMNDALKPLVGWVLKLVEGWEKLARTDPAAEMKKEQTAINAAVYSVIALKEGTDERTAAIEKLKKAYPDYFGFLDKEIMDNNMLLASLRYINAEYAARLILISRQKIAQEASDRYVAAQDKVDKSNDSVSNAVAKLRLKGLISEAESEQILTSGAVPDDVAKRLAAVRDKGYRRYAKRTSQGMEWVDEISPDAAAVVQLDAAINDPKRLSNIAKRDKELDALNKETKKVTEQQAYYDNYDKAELANAEKRLAEKEKARDMLSKSAAIGDQFSMVALAAVTKEIEVIGDEIAYIKGLSNARIEKPMNTGSDDPDDKDKKKKKEKVETTEQRYRRLRKEIEERWALEKADDPAANIYRMNAEEVAREFAVWLETDEAKALTPQAIEEKRKAVNEYIKLFEDQARAVELFKDKSMNKELENLAIDYEMYYDASQDLVKYQSTSKALIELNTDIDIRLKKINFSVDAAAFDDNSFEEYLRRDVMWRVKEQINNAFDSAINNANTTLKGKGGSKDGSLLESVLGVGKTEDKISKLSGELQILLDKAKDPKLTDAQKSDLTNKINSKENELRQQQIIKERKEAVIDAVNSVTNAVMQASQMELEFKIRMLDAEIQYRQYTVGVATELARRGNVEILKQETERLQKATAAKELAVRRQQQLSRIAVAAQQAENVAKAVGSIIEAAAGGDPYSIAFRVIAAVAALAAGVMTISSTVQSSQSTMSGFRDGGYTGDVGRNDVAGVVHGREFVHTAEKTAYYRPLFDFIHDNPIGTPIPMLQDGAIAAKSSNNDEIKSELAGIKQAIYDTKIIAENKMDGYGVTQMIEKYIANDKRRFA